jgi:ankyrin repeat protein
MNSENNNNNNIDPMGIDIIEEPSSMDCDDVGSSDVRNINDIDSNIENSNSYDSDSDSSSESDHNQNNVSVVSEANTSGIEISPEIEDNIICVYVFASAFTSPFAFNSNLSELLKTCIQIFTNGDVEESIKIFNDLIVADENFEVNYVELLSNIHEKNKNQILNGIFEKRTLIQRALISKNMNLVKLLLKQGANIFSIPKDGNSIFHLAIYDTQVLKQLLEIITEMLTLNPDCIPIEMGKVLYYAIFEKKFDSLEILLNSVFIQFINIDIMNVTPLHIALGEGHPEVVKLLIDAGADVFKTVQKDCIQPIHVACAKGDMQALSLLISHFEKIVEQRMNNGEYCNIKDFLSVKTKETLMTPLHFASFRGNYKALCLLLQYNANVLNYQSKSGMTALHYAVTEGHVSCTQRLLTCKPDIFLEDRNGNNTLIYASFKNKYNCGILLTDHLNRYTIELSRKQNLLLHQKIQLVLFVVDTTKVEQIKVKSNPNFEQTMQDLAVIKNVMDSNAVLCCDDKCKSVSWKKYKLLHLHFEEENSFGSGILRHYFSKISEIIFNSKLFCTQDNNQGDGTIIELAHLSNCDNIGEYLEIMKLIGFYLALVTLTNPVYLPLADYFYKVLTNETVTPYDFLDKSYLNALTSFENMSNEELKQAQIPFIINVVNWQGINEELAFSDLDEFVTKENLEEYKRRLLNTVYYSGYKQELLQALKAGFNEVIPAKFLTFNVEEKEEFILNNLSDKQLVKWTVLKNLISKVVPIDLDDWYNNTNYMHCNINTPQVKWFWNYVRNNNDEKNRLLIEFATGTKMLPHGSFAYLKTEKIPFTLALDHYNIMYPKAKTCTYILTLPFLPNEETFVANMDFALSNYQGFSEDRVPEVKKEMEVDAPTTA